MENEREEEREAPPPGLEEAKRQAREEDNSLALLELLLDHLQARPFVWQSWARSSISQLKGESSALLYDSFAAGNQQDGQALVDGLNNDVRYARIISGLKSENSGLKGTVSGLAYAISSSATAGARSKFVLQSDLARDVAGSIDELIPGIALPPTMALPPKLDIPEAKESALQDALVRFLRAVPDAELEVIDSSTRAIAGSSDKPDVLLASKGLFEAARAADRCTWAMACFVAELKTSAFTASAAGCYSANEATSWLTKDGLEAFSQLLDRRIGFGHSEPMFGAIVDPRRVMFWRFENHEASNLLRISRWPAEPLPLQERVDDRPSGLDHLAALCRTPATYLRPSTAQGDFVALLDGLRAELRLGERPMVPVVPLNLGRPVVLNVYSFPSEGDARRSADPTDVIKMWRAGLERRANMEFEIMDLGMDGIAKLHRGARGGGLLRVGDWCGVRMQWHGPTTLSGALKYFVAHARLQEPWPEVKRVVGEIAAVLLDLHGRGYVHSDVKPSNVVLGGIDGGQFKSVAMVDFEHAVRVGMRVSGYTSRFCARCLAPPTAPEDQHNLPDLPCATRSMDWESLFNSALGVVVHEIAYVRRAEALESPEEFWRTAADEIARYRTGGAPDVYPRVKEPLHAAIADVVDYMTRFAEAIVAATGTGRPVPDGGQDEQLEAAMRRLFSERS